MWTRRSFLSYFVGAGVAAAYTEEPQVTVIQTPENGVQPQAAVDARGTIHLIYLYGDPAAADIGYTFKRRGERDFSKPVRVNSQPGSAIAVGTMRGARLALGRAGRVHVAWNGSRSAEPRAARDSSPMLYARMRDDGRGFEPQKNLNHAGWGLDGGTVAADRFGHVYVAWHAQPLQAGGAPQNEGSRRVWLARSSDDGRTFEPDVAVSPKSTGVCGCCGMAALADREGNLYLMYRSAREIVHRDMYLLFSRDQGKNFEAVDLQAWEIGACPMSTSSLYDCDGRVMAAWETNKQIYFATLSQNGRAPAKIIPVPGSGDNRKHPALAIDKRGNVLLAWTEGTGWKKGGTLHWDEMRLAEGGIAQSTPGTPEPVTAWNAPAAVTVQNRFLIIC
ncbi:MAG TPA: sialidase family protein [Bryobacteraceae bacterium]|nr:sialidase family protein [Bryobacteraceae bacterium]